ncbi:Mks condensin complex protein MksB, partial [Pseudomonas aeruginosa]
IEAYRRHLECLAVYLQASFETRDIQDLARHRRLLDLGVRDVLKKLGNDEQALIGVSERAKTIDRQIPLAQRYAEVLATWDEYGTPIIQLGRADGSLVQGVRRVDQILLRLLGEQQRPGQLVDDDLVLRTHARILEMQTNAQLTLR